MFEISKNNIITMNRGDYGQLHIFINLSTPWDPKKYLLTETDKVCFYVTEPHQLFEHAIIKKVYTVEDTDEDGCVIVTFDSKDTFYLEPGTYYYEVKLVRGDKINTVTSRTKLIILE